MEGLHGEQPWHEPSGNRIAGRLPVSTITCVAHRIAGTGAFRPACRSRIIGSGQLGNGHKDRGILHCLEAVAGVGHDEQVSVLASQDCGPEIMRTRPLSKSGLARVSVAARRGAFGGVPATGAGAPVDSLLGPRARSPACRHCPGPATACQPGHPVGQAPAFPKIRRA
jgi:hypothetical protein